MKKRICLFFLLISAHCFAQDSVATKKISNEIGVNSVLLIKQVLSNNPSNTLSQLPYQVIYTLHFNKSGIGVRLGLGINQSSTETEIQGLNSPRKTTSFSSSIRLGINKNFVTYKKIVCNAFLDITNDQANSETTTETTDQFNVSTLREKISSKSSSTGGEIGFGVKYCFNKHIALYIETPLQIKFTATVRVTLRHRSQPSKPQLNFT